MPTTKQSLVTLKDLMRLFFLSQLERIIVVGPDNKPVGVINKIDVTKSSADLANLHMESETFIANNLIKITEDEIFDFLKTCAKIRMNRFPVLNLKGQIVDYWDKKKLLACILHDLSESADENFYKEILDNIPVNFVVVDRQHKIIYAGKEFYKRFEFMPDLILNQKLTKFLPQVKNKFELNKIYKISYRHKDWQYRVFRIANNNYIYVFDEFIASQPASNLLEQIEKGKPLQTVIENIEKEIIKQTLSQYNWNINETAFVLKLPKESLQYKIAKYKIL